MEGEALTIGDWGHAVFVLEKRGRTTPINCYGTIKAIEKKYILFEDNENFLYLIETSKFEFTVEQFKNMKL